MPPKQSTKSAVERSPEGMRTHRDLAGLNLAVEHRSLDQLIPYARNARTHSPAQVEQIAASIQSFGWTNPILVDGENGVIAGHGRLLAAKEVGLSSVPVIELAGLSEAEKRAYLIADNKLALNAGWDEALLAAEVADLQALGVDLNLTGFDAGEIDDFLAQSGATPSFSDEAPPPPTEPLTRPGDLWLLGHHRLLCGDATRVEDLRRVLDDRLADLVFTDPPYNVAYQGKSAGRRTIANDDLGAGFAAFLQAACFAMLPLCKGALYICMSSAEIGALKQAFEEAGGHWSTFVIWAKNAFTLGRSDYQRQYEPILYGWPEGSDHYWCGARDQGDLWSYDRPTRNDLHPTMKPVALMERAIRNSSKTRDTVLDPFAGSGTMLMAAEATGRTAALVELDPAYCEVIVRRWQEGTGGTAVRADGTVFVLGIVTDLDRAALAAYCQAYGRWAEAERKLDTSKNPIQHQNGSKQIKDLAPAQATILGVFGGVQLKESPVLLRLPSGYIQPSPSLAIANKQLELMAKYMAELGLSPVSRTRVEAKPPHEKKLWEFGREWVDPRPKL